MDDATLVTAARSDPGRGFAAIYERHGDRIHDYCLAVLRQREDAADATQDTFVIAYERLAQLRDPSRLKPWLYAIARSRCLRRLKDRDRQRPTDEEVLEPLGPAAPAVTGEVESAELRQLVWEAAAGLADDDRAVLDLHLRQGLSGADLASALGVPAEKANLMLHRMKQRMGRTIGALLVARTGRADCPDLAALATGQLTPLARKRLARHVDGCQVCRERRDRLTPELLYASVPLVAAPLAVGERIAELTAAGTTAGVSGELRWQADGFPRPEPIREPMPVPHRLAVGAGLAVVVVLGVLGGGAVGRTIAGSDPPPVAPAAVASAGAASTPTAPLPPTGTPGAAPPGARPDPSQPGPTSSLPPTASQAAPPPTAPPPTVQITSPASGERIDDPNSAIILHRELSDPLGQGLTETWTVTYPYFPLVGIVGPTEEITPLPLFPFGASWRPIDTFDTDRWCDASGLPLLVSLQVRDTAGRTATAQVSLATSPCLVVD